MSVGWMSVLQSLACYVVGPLLWVSGMWLFLNSQLSRTRKFLWTLFLVVTGMGIGTVLSLTALRSKFVLVLVVLPIAAVADALWMKKGFFFWIRACGFEVGTIFASAAVFRYVLERVTAIP